jgi:hypothetical protein
MPKPNRTNVPRELFDTNEIEMHTQEGEWYIVPVVIIGTLCAFIIIVGADRFIEVMSDFIVGIRTP